ncbi:MAG: hypothetical protein WCK84_01180 [Bacteroidota bacterium]
MRQFIKLFILLLFFAGGCQVIFAQASRSYSAFNPAKNNAIKRFDTLKVGHCYNLDDVTTIGLIFRYYLGDMWVGAFKNNRNREPVAAFDTVNVSDSTHLYFYRTNNTSDGIVVIWESRYIYDSELRAYMFKDGNLKKMGKIDVDLDDALVTRVSYPVSKIRISTDGRKIKFTFKEHLKLRISQPFAPEDFYYIYEGGNQLIPVKKGKIGKPVW